jgi:YVTN family beta-propeller protein
MATRIRAGRVGSLLAVSMVAAFLPIGSGAAGALREPATATISLPGDKVAGVAVNPQTDTAYVTGFVSPVGTVSVVDLATSTVTATITVGDMPGAVAVNPVTGTVYVANRADRTISVIDGASGTVTGTIALPATGVPTALAVDTATGTVYAGISGAAPGVAVISGSTNSVIATITGQSAANVTGIAYDPATGALYAAFGDYPCCSRVLVIDGATNSVTTTVALPDYPQAIVADPATSAFYVSGSSSKVWAYSTATGALTGSFGALRVGSLADNPDTHTVYAALEDSAGYQAIGLINSPATAFTSGVPAPGPGSIAVDQATDTLVDATAAGPDSTISVIPLQAPQITSRASATFTVGKPASFDFSATGTPALRISVTGKLPAGTWLRPIGELTGTPDPGSGGIYPVTIHAANGITPAAAQRFTLTVDQPPAITSASHATFTHGKHGSFTVRTAAFPTASVTERGGLPPGLRFTAGKNGTATISGTPARSARGKTYVIWLTARNAVGPAATQRFSLRVN